MTNSIFNLNNVEFGPNKDENIASTLMGVAVKNGDSWRIYDKSKKEITNVGNMQLDNLPIFILPTTKLKEGDLIKDEGEYYFVMKMEDGVVHTLHAMTGVKKIISPNINLYFKVVAFKDSISICEDFDVEMLATTFAMRFKQYEIHMDSMLPLLLFHDKLIDEKNVVIMMLMSSTMAVQNYDPDLNRLFPFLFLKEMNSSEKGKELRTQIISLIMGDNNDDPVMRYLMSELKE